MLRPLPHGDLGLVVSSLAELPLDEVRVRRYPPPTSILSSKGSLLLLVVVLLSWRACIIGGKRRTEGGEIVDDSNVSTVFDEYLMVK